MRLLLSSYNHLADADDSHLAHLLTPIYYVISMTRSGKPAPVMRRGPDPSVIIIIIITDII